MSRSRFGLTTLAVLSLATLPGDGAYAQKVTPAYTFTDLGGLPNPNFVASEARAINDSGQVVGFSYVTRPSGTVYHPVVWAKDSTGKYVITDLGTLGGNSGKALGINNQGEIVGIAQAADTGIYAFLIHPLTVNGSKVWYQDLNLDGINDLMTNLGVAVDDSENKGISDNTQIAAGVNLVQFDGAGNEVVTTLPRNGTGYAINDNRQVAGMVDDAIAPLQPAIWQVDAAGNALSMITLAPLPGNTYGEALCINALGQAAGASSYVSGNLAYPRATLWRSGATPTDLGSLATQSTSQASGINTVNGVLQVVGAADILNRGERGFVWKNGVMMDLNTLISASGVTVSGAFAINTQGQIAGRASVTVGKKNTELHGYLLTPR
jgi:probable HAF family extracellular repeat protein